MKPEELNGMAVSVIGAGKSGIAAAELLLKAGACPLVSEFGAITTEGGARLRALGIPFEEGGHSDRVYDAALCIASPGIPPTVPVLVAMESKGIPVVSEIELASWFCRARIIAITGTDGKTTTATLIHHICRKAGDAAGFRAFSVGNIGVPFASKVLDMSPSDIAVLELSSYQLERCFAFRPDIAVMTNITPDHMDRYGGDIGAYAAAKFRIHARQGSGDSMVFNHDDPLLREHFDHPPAGMDSWPFRLIRFSLMPESLAGTGGDSATIDPEGLLILGGNGRDEVVVPVETVLKPSFRGDHNLYNALAAAAATRAAGIPAGIIASSLAEFSGVEHRQEFAGNACGLDWINDSKATNVNAMRQALQAVPSGMVLIAGGRDKGNDYSPVEALVREKVSCVVAIGESREKIVRAFEGVVPVHAAASLAEAVMLAAEVGRPGSTVLFSPACSSFDMFSNFEERGDRFKQLVRELSP